MRTAAVLALALTGVVLLGISALAGRFEAARAARRPRRSWSREIRVALAALGASVLVSASFAAGYVTRVVAERDAEVVEFCVVDEAGAGPDARPGELAFADPGSGCPAGQLLLCGRYDPMEATADGFRSLDVVEHLVTSADC